MTKISYIVTEIIVLYSISVILQAGALGESMCPTFTTPGDALPAGRNKVIHSVGVVGRVEWRDAGGHPYTGVFKEKL